MRRVARHLDRYGTPLAPLSADELRPVNAPVAPRPGQCAHGGDFRPRCERIGTYKIRPDMLPKDERLRRWTDENTRYCAEHAGIFCVPANDEVEAS